MPLFERGLHSYTFSDVSAAFFSGAAQKLAAFSEVEFKIFDLEKPGIEQELEAGAFDFIIGTNVLHAVRDVRAALHNLHGLLARGGSLIFMDTATPQLWTETVFGLTAAGGDLLIAICARNNRYSKENNGKQCYKKLVLVKRIHCPV